VTSCGGELVLADIGLGPGFGAVLAQIPVGPMPDAVVPSPDGAWLAVANERDVVWGKCEGVGGLELPSVSLIDLAQPAADSQEIARLFLTGADEAREPEGLAFSADGGTLLVTLQDSHELGVIDVATLANAGASTPYDALPLAPNAGGADPWPDGIAALVDGAGRERFAIAGEANDTIMLVDVAGSERARLELSDADVPADLPRATDGWGPLFRPDSLAACPIEGRVVLGVSLKHSGALALLDVTDADAPGIAQVLGVGLDDQPTPEDGSSVAPEGVACASTPPFFVVANEGESSVTLLWPE
jgi:hypothetical protein